MFWTPLKTVAGPALRWLLSKVRWTKPWGITRDGTLRRRQTCLAVVEHDAEFNFDTIRFWHTDKKTVERVFKMRFAAASPEYTLRRVKLFYDDEANMFGPGIDPDYA